MTRRYHLITASLISLVFVLGGLVPASVREALRWSREASAIEWLWRSWCAHWLHLDLRHALLNVAGFLLVWVWLSTSLVAIGWFAVIVVAIITIDLGLWWFTNFEWYVGASAVIHAMAASGIAVRVIAGERFAYGIAAVGLIKLALEQWFEPGALVGGAIVATDAHFFGVLAGVCCGLIFATTGWGRPKRLAWTS